MYKPSLVDYALKIVKENNLTVKASGLYESHTYVDTDLPIEVEVGIVDVPRLDIELLGECIADAAFYDMFIDEQVDIYIESSDEGIYQVSFEDMVNCDRESAMQDLMGEMFWTCESVMDFEKFVSRYMTEFAKDKDVTIHAICATALVHHATNM